MPIVLDTNALIWLVRGTQELGEVATRTVASAISEGRLFVSAMSFWEVGMLVGKRRFAINRPLMDWRRQVLDLGISELPMNGVVGIASTELQGLPNDPADRIIVATSLSVGGTLVTADGQLLRWDGELPRQDARR